MAESLTLGQEMSQRYTSAAAGTPCDASDESFALVSMDSRP